MSKTSRVLGGTFTAALLLLAGCGGATSTPAGQSGPSGQLSIVTAFYPFQFVAERVAGPYASVSSLTAPGAEPHDVELTPKQVGSVGTASLVLYEKGFQPAVDEAVAQSGASNAFDTTTVVPLQPLAEEHDHAHEEGGHTEEAGSAEAQGLDPHVWLDPTKLATIASAVGDRLAQQDPAHAADYRANAKALTEQLTTLDGEFAAGLKSCQIKEFITTHAAFGYLAGRYGLEQIGINGLSPESEPSPARIAEVQTEAKEHRVTTIFYETLVSPAVAKSIAGDLGLKTAVLDPIEGITAESAGQDYLAVMRANLAALTAANDCR